jgi:cytoskeletal protein CcmA (bactofilin family)
VASNAFGRDPGRRESPFDSSRRDETRAEQGQSQPPWAGGQQSAHNSATESPAAGRVLSVIGPSLVFNGKLSADEDLLILGTVEGSIEHTAANLTIGAHGEVRADIVAQKVIIQGAVEGDVHASDTVVVEASARVHGNLFAPRIGLKDGAKFKGAIDMSGDDRENAARAGRKHGKAESRSSSGRHSGEGEELDGGTVDQLLEPPPDNV